MTSAARTETRADIGIEMIREWVPDSKPKAVVVLVHGIAEHSGRYERTGRLLADAGFHVRSFDLIGHGASGGARVDIDDWGRFHAQVEHHMVWARETGLPVILMGHSMGTLISMGYILDDRIAPDLLVLTAPTLAGGAAWQRALAGPVARIFPKLAMPQGVKAEQLSRDPEVGVAYFADPLVTTKATARFGAALFAAIDQVKSRLPEITVPILALHGGSDALVPPQTSAVLGDLANCERRVYPSLRHEILNEPEGPEIVAEIIEWANQRI